MAYEVYTNTINSSIPFESPKFDLGELKCEKVSTKIDTLKNVLYWNIATVGKVKAYVVYDENKLIHKSYVVKGKEKFRFLNRGDIEIGPCWTHPDYRGRGIYPYVLTQILKRETNEGSIAYMLIADTNLSSQNGVKKIGFVKMGRTTKKDILLRYRIEK